MKFSHQLDLEPLKERAASDVDRFYSARLPALHALHQAKSTEAAAVLAGRSDGSLLRAEAMARGISLEELSRLIIAKATEQHMALLETEARRIAVKTRIAAATTGQELDDTSRAHR